MLDYSDMGTTEGIHIIIFLCKGNEYNHQAEVEDSGLFDSGIITFLNKLLEEQKTGKSFQGMDVQLEKA